MPKTAGTTTDKLFANSGLDLLWRDSQSSSDKHLPTMEHPVCSKIDLSNKQHVVNIRRLPSWLLSNYQHKRVRMGLNLQIDSVRQGLFWRDRDSRWLQADWWLERFGIDDSWSFLRVERLKHDFISILSDHESITLPSQFRLRFVNCLNTTAYDRTLSNWFSASDLLEIYKNNPRWSSLEKSLYGDLLSDY